MSCSPLLLPTKPEHGTTALNGTSPSTMKITRIPGTIVLRGPKSADGFDLGVSIHVANSGVTVRFICCCQPDSEADKTITSNMSYMSEDLSEHPFIERATEILRTHWDIQVRETGVKPLRNARNTLTGRQGDGSISDNKTAYELAAWAGTLLNSEKGLGDPYITVVALDAVEIESLLQLSDLPLEMSYSNLTIPPQVPQAYTTGIKKRRPISIYTSPPVLTTCPSTVAWEITVGQ
ncbi:hypothetical protein TREMEDRAFT_62139 [Tremella mesenterica DSM 1558]|uniref:uncharacterized protein n=1 Tax=Tremella mesenterica (strain ATCC 24925 / CBS 8224 / DSM 1558 / NBRC 9311 / NRRL Y-6157 / RJB 2259-6 / UBC 559-6) TaxID=578456 RepID=UPI0003F49866|nr:uncharacterized protein TREMEDRAFT_62139 [Tremella mesenterica DSM 1558]EIW69280.1 hypothetical protein TREMEDRAFT_62139 [Tremella mesenterica DSM 1558]